MKVEEAPAVPVGSVDVAVGALKVGHALLCPGAALVEDVGERSERDVGRW